MLPTIGGKANVRDHDRLLLHDITMLLTALVNVRRMILWKQGTHQRNEDNRLVLIESVHVQECKFATFSKPSK